MNIKVTEKEAVIYQNVSVASVSLTLHFSMSPECGTTYVRLVGRPKPIALVGDGERDVKVDIPAGTSLEVHCDKGVGSVSF